MNTWLAGWMLTVLAVVVGRVGAAEVVRGDDFETELRWTFTNGGEFPGAKGSLERSRQAAHTGHFGAALRYDFSGGGAYVGAILPLNDAPELAAVRVWIKKPAGHDLTFRYTDSTGQTLQKRFAAPDDRWFDALIGVDSFTDHWGGANDGVVHGPPKQLAILIGNNSARKGTLAFDDVRLIPGTPGSAKTVERTEYVAASFEQSEGWQVASGTLVGKKLRLDWTRGSTVSLIPREFTLLGTPKEIRLRFRGKAAGHPVRLRLHTHFMAFEKTLGLLQGEGEMELRTAAPPGEGWRWYWGENDGKLHGPLRLTGLFIDRGEKAEAGEVELVDIRVVSEFPPAQACVLSAEVRGDQFVATVRSIAARPLSGLLNWTVRDWEGRIVHQSRSAVVVPAGARPLEQRIALPIERGPFLEAQVELDIADQIVPAVQAYSVAPIEGSLDKKLDRSSPFGMGLFLYRYPGDSTGMALRERAARMASEAGVKWSREAFLWGRIEPQKGKYDWTFYDNLVATAKRNGISIYGLLHGWSGWTRPYTQEGIEDYCRYAAAVVAHYRDEIQHWEVWNEPNIFFWEGPRDLYAQLLKQAYAAIKQANPNAKVLGCSTAGIDHPFIRRTMELGAPFDILTIHPYRTVLDDRAFIADLKKAAELVRRPDGSLREVWITEMGWGTHVPHNTMREGFAVTTQRRQAELLACSYIDAVASGVSPNISWYDFRNDGENPFNFEHNMGIITRDFRIKPAYRALATVTRMLKGKRCERELDLGDRVMAFRFADSDGGDPVVAMWSLEGEQTVVIPGEKPARVVDLMGSAKRMPAEGGGIRIVVRKQTPVFVVPE